MDPIWPDIYLVLTLCKEMKTYFFKVTNISLQTCKLCKFKSFGRLYLKFNLFLILIVYNIFRRVVWGCSRLWHQYLLVLSVSDLQSVIHIIRTIISGVIWRHHGHSHWHNFTFSYPRPSISKHTSGMQRSLPEADPDDQWSSRWWPWARGPHLQSWIHSRSSGGSGTKSWVSTSYQKLFRWLSSFLKHF